MTLGHETSWTYFTTLQSPHEACQRDRCDDGPCVGDAGSAGDSGRDELIDGDGL